jgi:hypothetical protein
MIREIEWKLALSISIKEFADEHGIPFAEVYAFFCEFICLNIEPGSDEEDAREVCGALYILMLESIELRKERNRK